MEAKRNKLKIIHDILMVIRDKNGKIKPTQILFKSNLSYQMMKEYLDELIKKGFITESSSQAGKTYSITDKGNSYLGQYKVILEFMNSFGLD